ncbi:hypothetical protein EVAR_57713_1 [Eumeta japonica]|uniref:Uncharacterized protein n=1 Tax=Eumeta variegata TaxID=151549 RepID=A0A4C1Y9N7_EUMVA|nr:hypothetical protein EVAR_57713_1 [Eumeta japonica]
MATSELRPSDRRGVTPHHLLYMSMKIMRIRVRDSLRIAFKHVGKNPNVTKEQIQSEDYVHGFIERNLAFLRSIPNSTWYWSEKKKDLCAMIRQLATTLCVNYNPLMVVSWPDPALDVALLLFRCRP